VGYGPSEIRRLWSILSLQRDLGVNLAGVEAIMRLRAHFDELHRCLSDLAVELDGEEPIEDDSEADDS
jgi:MerR family transcriptional regulator/heat shock protein HspR